MFTNRQDIKTKSTQELYDEIGDGNRYEGHYKMLWSAYLDKDIDTWKTKLLNDPVALGDKTEATINSVCKYIEENHSIDFSIPFEPNERHNIIEVSDYLLRDWEGKITWKDKGVILQKLYEGAGKTVGLKELRKKDPFIYK